jgi:hypothetical protein
MTVPLPSGTLNINAQPWGDVQIDGEPAGPDSLGNVSLPIGPHQIVFRHPQFGTQTRTVIVTASAAPASPWICADDGQAFEPLGRSRRRRDNRRDRPTIAAQQPAQPAIELVKTLYESAAHDEALGIVERLTQQTQEGAAPADGRLPSVTVERYRALCLLALNRASEAEQVIERMVMADVATRPIRTTPRRVSFPPSSRSGRACCRFRRVNTTTSHVRISIEAARGCRSGIRPRDRPAGRSGIRIVERRPRKTCGLLRPDSSS